MGVNMKIRSFLLAVLLALALPSLATAYNDVRPESLHKNATVDADGTIVYIDRFNTLALRVTISTTGTVSFLGSVDGVNFAAHKCMTPSTGPATSLAASNNVICDVTGLKAFKAPLSSADVAGRVTVEGFSSTGQTTGQQVFSFDPNGNLLVGITCISGESGCTGTSWLRVLGAAIQKITGMTGVTTNTTSATFTLPTGAKTPWATVTGTGAQVVDVALYCDGENTTTNGILIGTIALSATTKDVDQLTQFTKDCNWYHFGTANISGTSATVEAWVNVGIAGSGSGSGGGDASAANQTTLNGFVDGLEGAIGTSADAAATQGSTGTEAAKLRLMTAQLDTIGTRLAALIVDPCRSLAKIPITISQTTGTQLITGTASNRIYVCSVLIMQASTSTQTFSLVSGTGSVCGTSLGAVIGSTTAAAGMPASFVHGNGSGFIAKTDTDAENLCLLQSTTDRLAGALTYVVAPN